MFCSRFLFGKKVQEILQNCRGKVQVFRKSRVENVVRLKVFNLMDRLWMCPMIPLLNLPLDGIPSAYHIFNKN